MRALTIAAALALGGCAHASSSTASTAIATASISFAATMAGIANTDIVDLFKFEHPTVATPISGSTSASK